MSKLQLVKHAIRLWKVPHVDKKTNRANTRKWLASVERLGDKWLVGKPRTKDQLMPKGNQ